MLKDLLYGLRMLREVPWLHHRRAAFARPWHRREHRHLYRGPPRPAAPRRVSPAGPALVVWNTNPSLGIRQSVASVPDFEDWKAQNQVFQQMAALQAGSANITGIQNPRASASVRCHIERFFPVRHRARAGTRLRPGRLSSEGGRVVVLDYAFWQRSFGGDKNVLSKTITIDGANYSVIGVLPKQFFSFGRDLWKPLVFSPALVNARGSHNEFVVARLKPDVSFAAAQTEMNTIAKRIELAHPDTNTGNGVKLMVLTELFVGSIRPAMIIMFAAVGFVLLIACANVANLMLARASGRRREVAVRIALGGSRARIIRQLLTESLLLSCLAGGAGLLLAMWGTAALMKLLPGTLAQSFEVLAHRAPRCSRSRCRSRC